MDKQPIITGIIVDETTTISYIEICQKFHITEDVLQEMVEHGLFQDMAKEPIKMSFDYHAVCRIQSAHRLKEDLGINIPGTVLVLELLDELDTMRKELAILRHFTNAEEGNE